MGAHATYDSSTLTKLHCLVSAHAQVMPCPPLTACADTIHACPGRSDQASALRRLACSQQAGTCAAPSQSASHQRIPLADALRAYNEDDAEPPPPQLLKKFIAYARMHVHPQLSPEAQQV